MVLVDKRDGTGSTRAALDEAQSIVEAAEKRAQELTTKAEQLYATAKSTGYADGHRDAVAEVTARAVRFIQESTAISDKLAEEAAKLALAISATVIGEHIKVNPDAAKRIAIKAIKDSVIGDKVVIVTNPEDKPTLERALPELRKLASGAGVSIDEDPNLSRGGCIVRTEFGEVDASIEVLLRSIAERLGVAYNGR